MGNQYLPEELLTPQSVRNGAREAYNQLREESGDTGAPEWEQIPINIRQQRESQFLAFARSGPGPNEPGDPYERVCARMVRQVKEKINEIMSPAPSVERQTIEPPKAPPSGDPNEQGNQENNQAPSGAGDATGDGAPASTPPAQ